MKWMVVVVLVAACGGSSGDDGMSLGAIDARCKTLCETTEPMCGSAITTCEQQCQVRVQNMKPLCGTCLLENADRGTCIGGEQCCPHAEFPNSALDCGSACEGSVGVNPSPHPICNQICANNDPSCGSDVQSCLDTCDARVAGVSGLCALCLLDGANGGVCVGGPGGGQPCCPSPNFPTTVQACASVCGN